MQSCLSKYRLKPLSSNQYPGYQTTDLNNVLKIKKHKPYRWAYASLHISYFSNRTKTDL